MSPSPATPRPRPPRIRPAHQAAQVILRMSHDERDTIHDLARCHGTSTVRYLLDLVEADAERRGDVDAVPEVGTFPEREAEGPGPEQDRDPHAKAQHAIAVAAG